MIELQNAKYMQCRAEQVYRCADGYLALKYQVTLRLGPLVTSGALEVSVSDDIECFANGLTGMSILRAICIRVAQRSRCLRQKRSLTSSLVVFARCILLYVICATLSACSTAGGTDDNTLTASPSGGTNANYSASKSKALAYREGFQFEFKPRLIVKWGGSKITVKRVQVTKSAGHFAARNGEAYLLVFAEREGLISPRITTDDGSDFDPDQKAETALSFEALAFRMPIEQINNKPVLLMGFPQPTNYVQLLPPATPGVRDVNAVTTETTLFFPTLAECRRHEEEDNPHPFGNVLLSSGTLIPKGTKVRIIKDLNKYALVQERSNALNTIGWVPAAILSQPVRNASNEAVPTISELLPPSKAKSESNSESAPEDVPLSNDESGMIAPEVVPASTNYRPRETFGDEEKGFKFDVPADTFIEMRADGEDRPTEYASTKDESVNIIARKEVTQVRDTKALLAALVSQHPDWQYTLKKAQPDSVILSGFDGDMIFYRKSIMRGPYVASFQITYPRNLKKKYDDTVEMLCSSFEPVGDFAGGE